MFGKSGRNSAGGEEGGKPSQLDGSHEKLPGWEGFRSYVYLQIMLNDDLDLQALGEITPAEVMAKYPDRLTQLREHAAEVVATITGACLAAALVFGGDQVRGTAVAGIEAVGSAVAAPLRPLADTATRQVIRFVAPPEESIGNLQDHISEFTEGG